MDFEKLGTFYLGRELEADGRTPSDRLLLYDAKDLTTHAVIVGMTGSGKTGLGVGLIEEAVLDGIPVLAIDPKGDLANLALAFPDLAPADFEPWVDPSAASRKGQDVAAFAADQARTWRDGLASWGQGPERVARYRDAADVRVYTPGSTAGRPLSILKSFARPGAAVLDDPELLAERLTASVAALLTLIGRPTDPTGRDHVLLATLLEHLWRSGRDASLADLVLGVQTPPFAQVGVLPVDAFAPANERAKLAMAMNAVLASPGFATWLQGEPMDVQRMLYREDGRPRVAVVSVAHLGDDERLTVVALLLNEVLAWTRAQSGTGSLRALVYVDELFGFMPPVANPPTKAPLLTLLKQARAFGVGLALSTQNPVDLDYKGLSNAGTWFVGRLQTEQDKARLLSGLLAADGGGRLDRAALDATLSGLGSRTFLLHNVHEGQPALFQTRWVMSYLAGPLSREQIRRLSTSAAAAARRDTSRAEPAPTPVPTAAAASASGDRPFLPPHVHQRFVPAPRAAGARYFPFVYGVADVHYGSKTLGVDVGRRVERRVEPREGPIAVAWAESDATGPGLEATTDTPEAGVPFAAFPEIDLAEAATRSWGTLFERWLRTDGALALYRHAASKLVSAPDESERDFRVRCAHRAREARDAARDALRKKYEAKMAVVERRVLRDEQAIERERQQLQQRTLDSAVTVGTAILGAFLGRRSASRVSTAVRRASSVPKESGDVARAQQTLAQSRAELEAMQHAFETELAALQLDDIRPDTLELETLRVRPTTTDIAVRYVGVLWVPLRQDVDGRWREATD